jgi:hypothetical protein
MHIEPARLAMYCAKFKERGGRAVSVGRRSRSLFVCGDGPPAQIQAFIDKGVVWWMKFYEKYNLLGVNMQFVKGISYSIIDVLLFPFALVSAIPNVCVARWTKRLPGCTSIFNRLKVHPIRHHYYSPLVYKSDLDEPLTKARTINGLDLNDAEQLALLAQFNYRDELLAIPQHASDPRSFAYDNGAFGVGDAEYFYNMIRHLKPKKIIEVGCGQSTLLAQLAIGANRQDDPSYVCNYICVEPFEQPWLEQIGVTVLRKRIEKIDPCIVDGLEQNDIFFIDSSHVIRPQGDVLHEYLNLVGRLKPGVLVHVHDIFTPYDYHEQWIADERRLWNEQYLLEAFLCFNKSFRIIGALNYLWRTYPDRMTRACPVLSAGDRAQAPGSFWFTRIET